MFDGLIMTLQVIRGKTILDSKSKLHKGRRVYIPQEASAEFQVASWAKLSSKTIEERT